MVHDIFLDCPRCSHTVRVSSDLVGKIVECPDCGHEFTVPDIRDGLNPRLRRGEAQMARRGRAYDLTPLWGELQELEESLRNLLRRQVEQVRLMDTLEGNASLILKQLRLLEQPARDFRTGASTPEAYSPETSPAGASAARWLKWSRICGWITLGLALIYGLLLLRTF